MLETPQPQKRQVNYEEQIDINLPSKSETDAYVCSAMVLVVLEKVGVWKFQGTAITGEHLKTKATIVRHVKSGIVKKTYAVVSRCVFFHDVVIVSSGNAT